MKTFLKLLLLLVAVGYFTFAIVRYSIADRRQVCSGLDIQLHMADDGTPPIDTAYIHNLLVRSHFFPEGQRVIDIPLAEIDSTIEANPYVRDALVYADANGHLHIEVTPYKPIMHIIPDGAPEFCIATDGEVMPVSEWHDDLPVASGHISHSFASNRLVTLARILTQDPFWDDQIGQIYVARDSTVTLIPRVGDHTIRLGQLKSLRTKLAHVRTFYTSTLPQIGWNRYSELNLEYENQIIATRKRIK